MGPYAPTHFPPPQNKLPEQSHPSSVKHVPVICKAPLSETRTKHQGGRVRDQEKCGQWFGMLWNRCRMPSRYAEKNTDNRFSERSIWSRVALPI